MASNDDFEIVLWKPPGRSANLPVDPACFAYCASLKISIQNQIFNRGSNTDNWLHWKICIYNSLL